MFETVCQHAQGESLSFGESFFGRLPISQYARKLKHFGKPAPVFLLLILNGESHRHNL